MLGLKVFHSYFLSLWLCPLILFISAILIFLLTSYLYANDFDNRDKTQNIEGLEPSTRPIPGLSPYEYRKFLNGSNLFDQKWTSSAQNNPEGSTAPLFVGLGPLFDADSCAACHQKSGRGHPPLRQGEPLNSVIIKLSISGGLEDSPPLSHPLYGEQLNKQSIGGMEPEGLAFVEYFLETGNYNDGTLYQLRRPNYVFYQLAFGPLGDTTMISPRIAMGVAGLGFLEAIPESDILNRADPDDLDGDGISGRPNFVWDPISNSMRLGRFGWKANSVGLKQQVAAAAFHDMGLTSRWHPDEDCTTFRVPLVFDNAKCKTENFSKFELNTKQLSELTHYLKTLGIPLAPSKKSESISQGKNLFKIAGCADCHIPYSYTKAYAIKALSNKYIRPYTDLLLHDMGPALADNRPDFGASGQEWRTPPLWGLGTLQTINGHEFLLHDGRARNIEEAILWHGGEAKNARNKFLSMTLLERQALILFLRSL